MAKLHKPSECSKCGRKTAHKKMRFDGICHACVYYYGKHGTYERKITRRTRAMELHVCQNCKSQSIKYFLGGKYVCKRCASYYYHNGRHRPRHMDATHCRICGIPLDRTYYGNNGGKGRCHTCASYWRNHGEDRTQAMIKRLAPHGWCECGQPATKQVDLRTGGLYVKNTRIGTNDVVTAEVQEWAEWMCDECAGLEDEMRNIDTSDYTPTSMIRRE